METLWLWSVDVLEFLSPVLFLIVDNTSSFYKVYCDEYEKNGLKLHSSINKLLVFCQCEVNIPHS